MEVTHNNLRLCLSCAGATKLKFPQRQQLYSHLLKVDASVAAIQDRVKSGQLEEPDPKQVERLLRWLEQPQHHFISCLDNLYPERLAQIYNPPFYLLVAGDSKKLSQPQLAIVGSRHCSWYGKHWGHEFSALLCQSGLTITSGLALGIDATAHRAALAHPASTVAVMGSGFDKIYPFQHRTLVESIIDQGGAVLSEFLPGVPPRAANFPRRNRIISGLSLGTLVIEASLKSGSLITARYALEQNRNLYALPGALGKVESCGCHWLIQQGAMLVTQPQDILLDLQTGYQTEAFRPLNRINSSEKEKVALPFADVLATVEHEVTSVDVVAERVGQSINQVLVKLLELELMGWIVAVPGGYVRVRRADHV